MPNSAQRVRAAIPMPNPRRAASEAAGFAEKWPPLLEDVMAADVDDVLTRQFRFDEREWQPEPGFGEDPVGDRASEALPGLLHKYHGRVLVVTTGACAVHCRYCFRRHFPYDEHRLDEAAIERIAGYVAADDSIREVILSGGDPLVLSVRRLEQLISAVAAIPHVTRLRIHSRVPTVMPERMDAEMQSVLTGHRLRVVLVLHVNHSAELVDAVRAPLQQLQDLGVLLLNQSVLLASVNDSVDALVDLSERLFDLGVQPYYLHALDRVRGAAHFLVPIDEGRMMVDGMRARLPGFLVPRFVQEIAGEPSKTPTG